MESYDLIVAGAGPAGLCLARELAPKGLRILVLDKKKNAADVQYNTSGSYIDLKEWSLPSRVLNPIDSAYFASKNEHFVKHGGAGVIDRKTLLDFLDKESRKNPRCTITYSAIIREVRVGTHGISSVVYIAGGKTHEAAARVFVDCSGIGAVFARKTALDVRKTSRAVGVEYIVPLKAGPHTTDLFMGSDLRGGYGWIFPLNAKEAVVGFGTLDESAMPDAEQRLKDMWKIPRVAQRCELAPVRRDVAVLRTGKPLKRFHDRNVIIIGDSALQANPLVGEGIRFVMDAARIAARWIVRALEKDDLRLLAGYGREWKKKYRSQYLLAHWLQRRIKGASMDDNRCDWGVRKLARLSDGDFSKVMRGELTVPFMAKVWLRTLF